MERSKNLWLQTNAKSVNSAIFKINEERFKSSYQGQLDLGVVLFLMNGMINEINKLQAENDKLKNTKNENPIQPV